MAKQAYLAVDLTVNLFIDECLSPDIARILNEEGSHLAIHPLDFGGLGQSDHTVLKRCITDNLVIVTANAIDFTNLVGQCAIHPGLIILPCLSRLESEKLIRTAITFLEAMPEPPMDVMVNNVLELSVSGKPKLYALP
ncbi:MAG: DUF5615 family PIN-like protein [Pseudomonadota bacterium]